MANRARRKHLTDKDCVLVASRSETTGQVHKVSAPNIPCVFWPDGRVCWEANMFLLDEWSAGRSTRNGGGTLATYAANLAPFLQYVHRNKLSLTELTDNHIIELSAFLASEPHPRNPVFRRRHGNQVNVILRKALEFLTWCQEWYYPGKTIVGQEGENAQIHITRKLISLGQERDGRPKYRRYIWHDAMRRNESPRVVQPIGKAVMDALLEACEHSSKSVYTINRRRVIQKLAAEVGARRTELGLVTRKHVQDAINSLNGPVALMTFYTVKRRRSGIHETDETVLEERQAPVSRELLNELARFIKIHRAPLVKRLIKKGRLASDPEHVFLTEMGRPINPTTLTKELAAIRQIAGIKQRAHLHMYRHRKITLLVIYHLKEYMGQRLPMDVAATILTKVASITGHKNIASLWGYIDIAFKEMGIWDTTDRMVAIRTSADAIFTELSEIQRELPGMKDDVPKPVKDLLDRVSRLIATLLETATAPVDMQAGQD